MFNNASDQAGYDTACSRCVCRERFPGFSISTLIVCGPLSIIGYEPAGLTVHPPPQKKNDRGWVQFFRMGV